jgi:hypothetical protein
VLLRLGHAELMLNTAYEDNRPHSPDAQRVAAHRDTGLFFGCRTWMPHMSIFAAKGWT